MLGIDVNDTKTVKIKDAEFIICVLPYKIKVKLTAASLRYAGEKQDGNIASNSEKLEKFLYEQLEYVKYGVKGHKNIKTKEGKDIHFKADEEGNVHEDMLNMYLTAGIIPSLFSEIFKFNNLTPDEEKN